ncbi:MAG: endonuclease/exonuclease/phosphatase family metal-dependent hydrolase [Planctomycetota bacterium]|jgi:endonuclease/exonuclease/phosphatase family metal-dependent hydrolase
MHRTQALRGFAQALLLLTFTCPVTSAAVNGADSLDLKVMSWNIWHGGREDGSEVGPQRVIDVIRNSGADIVALQETYGSGELISEALGFHFQPRGTNVSIHSRYPIVEDISVFEEFKCVGSLIKLPDESRVAVYSIWLPYSADIWQAGTRDVSKPDTMLAACEASAVDLKMLWRSIEERLAQPAYAGIPIVIAGDFNSMSHLDYAEVGIDEYGVAVDWPTSHVLTQAGFRDSYRERNPHIDRTRDSTWTPRFPSQEQDRIDFIYYRSKDWVSADARVLRTHADGFPSDHAAVFSVLRKQQASPTTNDFRAVSYNIRHGAGTDEKLNLRRTARVLQELNADFVGLQEVDLNTERTGAVNQASELGRMLEMHAAFGTFMRYQGGRYGMGILSRHPIVDVRSLRLPDGGEPRVALLVNVRLPSDEVIQIVNVHFDWIDDDTKRFAQASELARYLEAVELPFILMGDFNDQPGSRTMDLFHTVATEAAKPRDRRQTFPATGPNIEIDFGFYAPADRWSSTRVEVIDEKVASDHCPVVFDLSLVALDPNTAGMTK